MRGLRTLFEEQFVITEEVLTDEQKENCFITACDIFFGEVDVHIRDNADPKELGEYEVIDTTLGDSNGSTTLHITPTDYETFKLPNRYVIDFKMVCDFCIVRTSKKNLDKLKQLGVDEEVAEQNLSYLELRQWLRERYNTSDFITVGI